MRTQPHTPSPRRYSITDLVFCTCASLKNHGVDDEVREMFDMGAETMDLPFEEKMKFEQGDTGNSAG